MDQGGSLLGVHPYNNGMNKCNPLTDFVVKNDVALMTFAMALPTDIYEEMDYNISMMADRYQEDYINAAMTCDSIQQYWDANLKDSMIRIGNARICAIAFEYAVQRQIQILESAIKKMISEDIDGSIRSLKEIYSEKTTAYHCSHSPRMILNYIKNEYPEA